MGRLVAGDALVSNFNNNANVQGTGTSIVQISPTGKSSVFAHITALPRGQSCPGGVGLTTALAILPGGWVVVGSLPTGAKGALPAVNPLGCLIVLDSSGTPVESVANTNIDGPWDMAMQATPTGADLVVTNVLSGSSSPSGAPATTGSCTVVRIAITFPAGQPPVLAPAHVVATGLPWKLNPATVVVGPTGVAIDSHGTAYVAETLTNSIIAIPPGPHPHYAHHRDLQHHHHRRIVESTPRSGAGTQRGSDCSQRQQRQRHRNHPPRQADRHSHPHPQGRR